MMTHEPAGAGLPGSEAASVWWWRHEDEAGAEITQAEEQRFASRADAETWLGQAFADLADEGVAAVTLFEGEREVFGPMSLSAG